MKPLIVLLVAFIVALLGTRVALGNFHLALSARIALSIMLLFTAIAHFAFTKGMAMMVPDFIPYKEAVIYITGLIEIAAAVGLQVSALRELTGWLLILFFLLLLPANIKAAVQRVDYQQGDFNGNGTGYLWFRIPLQILFIIWTYFATIKY